MNAKPLFYLSLLINVGLGIVLALLLVTRPAPASGPEAAAAGPSSRTNALISGSATNVVIQKITEKFDWRRVESADYKKYIANLRGIGCPEETIRDIIIADVNKLFESRRKEMMTSTNKFQYWKTGNNTFGGGLDSERMEKQLALNQEKRELLKELLGVVAPVEIPNPYANYDPYETMLDFLPAEKQSQIKETMTKYQEKMSKVAGDGQPDAEGMQKIKALRKDMETELAGILSPDEYRQYQMRMSGTASMMRYQLDGLSPSQEEFDKIFDIRKKYDDEFGMMGMPQSRTGQDAEKEKAARDDMNGQLKALLGDERYAEYARAQDFNYLAMYQATGKYGLPKDTAVKAYDMKQTAENAAQKIRGDTSLTPEQRDAALSDIRKETENSIQTVMGPKAWGFYQRQAKWLNNISQPPAPAAK